MLLGARVWGAHRHAALAPNQLLRLSLPLLDGRPGGGRGCSSFNRAHGLPVVYHEAYSAPQLPPGHRFPMGVFRRIYDVLLEDGTIAPPQVQRPPALPSLEQLHLAHDASYLREFLSGSLGERERRRIGFGDVTSTPVLVERTLAEVAGTLLTCRLALECGLACNTAGGTHHAFPSFGSGFCILNDAAVAARVLLREGAVQKLVILDLDVHQGDGTAAALADERRAFTVSLHCESNFPHKKQRSDLDVPLPDGIEDEDYLSIAGRAVSQVLATEQPDLVLYNAGVDPHAEDSLGRLCLTDTGLLRRDMLVLDACLGRGIPAAAYVGGGYSADLTALARRHALLHTAAVELWGDHRLSA